MNDDINMLVPDSWVCSDQTIKVLGVGGGGCNAVDYMYRHKFEGCSFLVCNTDMQALSKCAVPNKIQLGNGLGAGTSASKGRNSAIESLDLIKSKILDGKTNMLFITAGMGGGTGTGATPVIAKMAKDADILTVGVVTLPFKSEGSAVFSRAIDGIHELEMNVDCLILINNEKLYKYYGDELIQNAFPKTDEVLATAVRGIVELIKKHGIINIDFQDLQNMLRNSGMALMGIGVGNGENRIQDAIKKAFDSPLLSDFDLTTAKNVLLNITAGNNEHGLKMNQHEEINKIIAETTGNANKFKSGLHWDDEITDDTIKITAIATGFSFSNLLGQDIDMGTIIQINSDYRCDDEGAIHNESVPSSSYSGHIGFNTSENKARYDYHPEKPPVMLNDDARIIEELETIPAIRRIQK